MAAKPDQGKAAPEWPTFSIVVPTYQRRQLVTDVVRSLARLDYPGAVELIIVIDGSTDGTAEALREIEGPFPVRIIEQPNQGASEARNRGAAEAANEVILFLDDDMLCQPDLVREHARLHRDGADAVIGDTPIDPNSPPGFLPESVARWIASTRVSSPLSPFDVFTGQLSIRRSVFETLGGFDTTFTSAGAFGNEDADLGVRLLADYDVRHNPAAICRQHYVVSPTEYMDRARGAVAADLNLIRKHPHLSRELLEAKGRSRPVTRYIYRPLTRLRPVPRMLAKAATIAANTAMSTPLRSNRLLARFFSGARSLSYWSELRSKGWFPGSERLLVLCYHAIQDQAADPVLAPYGVPPERFTEHLNSLTARGFNFVGPDALASLLSTGAPLPTRAVLLTFDDCYSDLLTIAREVLQPRGIEALAFAVTSMDTNTNEWDQPEGARRLELLGAAQLQELTRLGVEIGSHSRTHRDMRVLLESDRADEAARSADDLELKGLPRPRFFAYPYGARDSATKQAVREAGFVAAFGLTRARVSAKSDPFDLPRVIILAQDRGTRFRLKTKAPRLSALAEHPVATLKSLLGKVVRHGHS